MEEMSCDFIRVLSAEDTCPQCAESYAWVDQRFCVGCMTAVCPDCVAPRTRAEGSPLCRVCYHSDEEPTRPIPRAVLALRSARRRLRTRLAHGMRAWSVRATPRLRELARTLRRRTAQTGPALVAAGRVSGIRTVSAARAGGVIGAQLALRWASLVRSQGAHALRVASFLRLSCTRAVAHVVQTARRGGRVARPLTEQTWQRVLRLASLARRQGARVRLAGGLALRRRSREVRARGRALAARARVLATCATLSLALFVGTARTQLQRDGS